MICEWGQSFCLVFAHPLSTQGRLSLRCSLGSPCLPRGAVCRSRLRGCPFGAFRCSGRLIFRFRTDPPSVRRCSARLIRQAEALELQPRSRPPSSHTFAPKRSTSSRFAASDGRGELRSPLSPHRNVFSKHPGVPHGLFYDQAILWLDLQNAHAPGSLRSPSGGRGELRSPLHPPLPPPLFIGRFAAFDRQIPKEDVFIPPNAAFAQLSLAHSAAFCYSFLNNRTRCGKRRLLL